MDIPRDARTGHLHGGCPIGSGFFEGALTIREFGGYLKIADVTGTQLAGVVHTFLGFEWSDIAGAVGVVLNCLLGHVFITIFSKGRN